MNRYLDQSWVRHGLLLLALSAGVLPTFFVPPAQKTAARHESARPAAESRETAHRDVNDRGYGAAQAADSRSST